ncbi:MAG: hypothetical protein H7Y00_05770 [Fimbriimonadaceae bacterium]|nr:hypothetical protein [Chitinophagales bacterium]
MKQILHWFIRCLLYSNVFIAICAMAFTAQAYYLLQLSPEYDVLIIFNGVSTFFTYMLIRVAAIKRISNYETEERWEFFLKNIQFIRILTTLAFIVCCVLFFFLKREVQYALIVPGIISVLYGIPLKLSRKLLRLRDVGVAKIFLISFVWAYIGSVLPVINADEDFLNKGVWLLFAANFLFIFGITLPFDIKDLRIDAIHSVKTIPKLLGTESTYTLSFLSLFISGALHFYLQRNISVTGINYTVPIGVFMLITGLTIYLTRKKQNNFVFFGLLDGMILLQFLLIYFYKR